MLVLLIVSFVGIEYVVLVMVGCLSAGYFLLFLKLEFLLSWLQGMIYTHALYHTSLSNDPSRPVHTNIVQL